MAKKLIPLVPASGVMFGVAFTPMGGLLFRQDEHMSHLQVHDLIYASYCNSVSAYSMARNCTLPVMKGPCEAAMPRFFFNATSRQCEKFLYGGCGGNANNFYSLNECLKECKSRCKFK